MLVVQVKAKELEVPAPKPIVEDQPDGGKQDKPRSRRRKMPDFIDGVPYVYGRDAVNDYKHVPIGKSAYFTGACPFHAAVAVVSQLLPEQPLAVFARATCVQVCLHLRAPCSYGPQGLCWPPSWCRPCTQASGQMWWCSIVHGSLPSSLSSFSTTASASLSTSSLRQVPT